MNRHRTLAPVLGKLPSLASGAFVAPSATVVGDVQIGSGASVFYGSVIRGAHSQGGRGGTVLSSGGGSSRSKKGLSSPLLVCAYQWPLHLLCFAQTCSGDVFGLRCCSHRLAAGRC